MDPNFSARDFKECERAVEERDILYFFLSFPTLTAGSADPDPDFSRGVMRHHSWLAVGWHRAMV